MNVGYIGPFYDATGYSYAAIRTALALDACGANVEVINIKLANQSFDPPKRIQELENNKLDTYDVVIQNTLPPGYAYRAGFKNIGYSFFETSHIRPSMWQYNINLMDQLLVSSTQNKECIENSVNYPIDIGVIPIPAIMDDYNRNLPKIKFPNPNAYSFYTISDYSSRKNIKAIIKAYLTEFNYNDNVKLILKCYVENHQPSESKQIIEKDIHDLKISLRRNMYPQIYLITEYLSPDMIQRLHITGDCFVSAERGAAWNIPAFDSMAYGNDVIVNGWGGQTQFVKGKRTALLNYKMTMVEGMVNCPYKQIYTSYEQWADPDISDLKEKMRLMYNSRLDEQEKQHLINERKNILYEKYDITKAGHLILETISK